jgi:hypothetical protein
MSADATFTAAQFTGAHLGDVITFQPPKDRRVTGRIKEIVHTRPYGKADAIDTRIYVEASDPNEPKWTWMGTVPGDTEIEFL